MTLWTGSRSGWDGWRWVYRPTCLLPGGWDQRLDHGVPGQSSGSGQRGNHGRYRQGLIDSARHVIKRMLHRHFMNHMASYDVASTIHQSLAL